MLWHQLTGKGIALRIVTYILLNCSNWFVCKADCFSIDICCVNRSSHCVMLTFFLFFQFNDIVFLVIVRATSRGVMICFEFVLNVSILPSKQMARDSGMLQPVNCDSMVVTSLQNCWIGGQSQSACRWSSVVLSVHWVHVSELANPIKCILCCVMWVLWMILYCISLMLVFLDILKMLLQMLFQNWLSVLMLRSFSHLFIGIWCVLSVEDISLYSFECFFNLISRFYWCCPVVVVVLGVCLRCLILFWLYFLIWYTV